MCVCVCGMKITKSKELRVCGKKTYVISTPKQKHEHMRCCHVVFDGFCHLAIVVVNCSAAQKPTSNRVSTAFGKLQAEL